MHILTGDRTPAEPAEGATGADSDGKPEGGATGADSDGKPEGGATGADSDSKPEGGATDGAGDNKPTDDTADSSAANKPEDGATGDAAADANGRPPGGGEESEAPATPLVAMKVYITLVGERGDSGRRVLLKSSTEGPPFGKGKVCGTAGVRDTVVVIRKTSTVIVTIIPLFPFSTRGWRPLGGGKDIAVESRSSFMHCTVIQKQFMQN